MEQELLVDDFDAFLVRDFLSTRRCAALIRETELEGYTTAPVTTEHGPVDLPDIRNNHRVIWDDEALAEELWDGCSELDLPWEDGCRPLGLNPRFRFYRYRPGQYFRPHYDGAYATEQWRSRFTVLIYLNDDCHGGDTVLHDHDLTVTPETGLALFFRHAQLHEGTPVLRGQKYVLRTDLMYEP